MEGMRQRFTELLSVSTMTLATYGADGEPHAAPVFFVADEDLHLYFFSEPGSQHSRDIALNPSVALAIYPETLSWQEIRGLQLRGKVQEVPAGPDWDTAWMIYLAKFPFVSDLKAEVSKNLLYAFIPHWIRLVDNRFGFGFKEEWNL